MEGLVWAHLEGPEAARRIADAYLVEHGRRIQVRRFARVFRAVRCGWEGRAVCGLGVIGGGSLHVVSAGEFVAGAAVCRCRGSAVCTGDRANGVWAWCGGRAAGGAGDDGAARGAAQRRQRGPDPGHLCCLGCAAPRFSLHIRTGTLAMLERRFDKPSVPTGRTTQMHPGLCLTAASIKQSTGTQRARSKGHPGFRPGPALGARLARARAAAAFQLLVDLVEIRKLSN